MAPTVALRNPPQPTSKPSDPADLLRASARGFPQREAQLAPDHAQRDAAFDSLPSLPARTLADPAPGLPAAVEARQAVTTTVSIDSAATGTLVSVPGGYHYVSSSPDPGTVAGIVIGSVAGAVLLCYLIWTAINFGKPSPAPATGGLTSGRVVGREEVVETVDDTTSGYMGTESVVTRHTAPSHRKHGHRHGHHHRRSSGDTAAIRTRRSRSTRRRSASPRRHSMQNETVQIRRVSSVRPPTSGGDRRRSTSRRPSRPVTPSDAVSDEDEIVVIEQDSPSARRNSRRKSRRMSGGAPPGAPGTPYREVRTRREANGDVYYSNEVTEDRYGRRSGGR